MDLGDGMIRAGIVVEVDALWDVVEVFILVGVVEDAARGVVDEMVEIDVLTGEQRTRRDSTASMVRSDFTGSKSVVQTRKVSMTMLSSLREKMSAARMLILLAARQPATLASRPGRLS